MKSIVAKFGGTSMATAKSIGNVAKIIKSLPDCRIVVVSAPGRRFIGDEKVTDLLLQERIVQLANRFEELAQYLGVPIDLRELRSISPHEDRSLRASRGEHLSAQLLTHVLGAPWTWVDAAEVMRFHEDGSFDEATSYALIRREAEGRRLVMGGFYGATVMGRVVTFDRGGSDITGAHCAAAVQASVYYNYTDVEGVFTDDPRKNSQAQHFRELCAGDLLNMNACVVHADAVQAASAAGVPIRVASTFNPNGLSTLIRPQLETRVAV